MVDVVIEKEEMINDEIIEELPKPKKKRNFVFTEKRRIALEKGRIKRLQNLKKKNEDLAEFKKIKKEEKLNKLKDKVLEEIDEEIEDNEEETIKDVKSKIKEKIPDDSEGEAEGISDYEEEEEIIYKKKPKRRKKKKKIVYLSSESESDDDNYRVYKRRLKPSKQLATITKETIPQIKNKYSNIF